MMFGVQKFALMKIGMLVFNGILYIFAPLHYLPVACHGYFFNMWD